MRIRTLGAHGPELSVIGFGAWEAGGGREWGASPPDDEVVEAIRTVFETGINWIDTAEGYGAGHSEELVARAVEGRRDEVLIATKVAPEPDGTGHRPKQVREACRKSLRRLRVDHLDLYQLHWPDRTGVPVEDTWGAMAGLVDEGLVRFVGVSNFDRELIERCLAVRHVDSLQQEFSMLRLRDRDLIRWCGEAGVGVVTYGPLAYGLLTGAITADTTFEPEDHRVQERTALFGPGNRERHLAAVGAMRPIAEGLGLSLAQLALAWNVHQAGVASAIAGSRSRDHIVANADAGDVELDDETLARLDDILSEEPAR
ncbi:MAG TPA: aldo/keto reductase [Actinomycetota bacterium]